MTYDTYDSLHDYIGNKDIPNHLWVELISESFYVSKTVARKMLHSMYYTRSMLTDIQKEGKE